MLVNGKKIYKFKADNKNVDFPTQLYLRSTSKKFGAIDFRKVSLEGNGITFQLITIPLINLTFYTFLDI